MKKYLPYLLFISIIIFESCVPSPKVISNSHFNWIDGLVKNFKAKVKSYVKYDSYSKRIICDEYAIQILFDDFANNIRNNENHPYVTLTSFREGKYFNYLFPNGRWDVNTFGKKEWGIELNNILKKRDWAIVQYADPIVNRTDKYEVTNVSCFFSTNYYISYNNYLDEQGKNAYIFTSEVFTIENSVPIQNNIPTLVPLAQKNARAKESNGYSGTNNLPEKNSRNSGASLVSPQYKEPLGDSSGDDNGPREFKIKIGDDPNTYSASHFYWHNRFLDDPPWQGLWLRALGDEGDDRPGGWVFFIYLPDYSGPKNYLLQGISTKEQVAKVPNAAYYGVTQRWVAPEESERSYVNITKDEGKDKRRKISGNFRVILHTTGDINGTCLWGKPRMVYSGTFRNCPYNPDPWNNSYGVNLE